MDNLLSEEKSSKKNTDTFTPGVFFVDEPNQGIVDEPRSIEEMRKDAELETSMTLLYDSLPESQQQLIEQAQKERLSDGELDMPFGPDTQKALMKDADLFPPVRNADGTTTYSVMQIGMTDRQSPDGAINRFSRRVDITVPPGAPSLSQCECVFNPRENIDEGKYNELLERSKKFSPDITLFTHGVSADAHSADQQALKMQLSTGRPVINVDWDANPAANGMDPVQGLVAYKKDTAAALRANNNPAFVSALDKTIENIGADNASMIGFSHGGMFDTRYLKHRVETNMPDLDTVILTHPDVPLGASELWYNHKPRVLGDSADHTYVIGSRKDLALKMGSLVDHLTEKGLKPENRLGNYGFLTRLFLKAAGAESIKEKTTGSLGTQHFLNYAGLNELLRAGDKPQDQVQNAFNSATDAARPQRSLIEEEEDELAITQQEFIDFLQEQTLYGSDLSSGLSGSVPSVSDQNGPGTNGVLDFNALDWEVLGSKPSTLKPATLKAIA